MQFSTFCDLILAGCRQLDEGDLDAINPLFDLSQEFPDLLEQFFAAVITSRNVEYQPASLLMRELQTLDSSQSEERYELAEWFYESSEYKDLEIRSLSDLTDSDQYQNGYRFPTSSDGWLEDPERMERVQDYAADGADGSYHWEIIEDLRSCLASLNLPAYLKDLISEEIDRAEEWHRDNGTLDEIVG